ncbi:SDR family oxidoreductase [Pseudoxanthomonas sp. UTMC 1351]|uniref:SDR family oxidoreductase n=1 Tax=Pseudoxanthomonas sp. UTMC 1351 TaxID=2695853 RepID=UPI0034CF04D6
MRILVIGASGLIGRSLVRRLVEAGHAVVLGVRNEGKLEATTAARFDGLPTVHADYARQTTAEAWRQRLKGIDVVVNAVGIFREQGNQTFDALHVKAPVALFEAAVAAGVRRIVQISALGADPQSPFAYFSSKGRADAALAALPISSVVLRPSLVFAPNGASSRWFMLLAALPLTPLPGSGRQPIQPVHLDDLCEATLRLIEGARGIGNGDGGGAAIEGVVDVVGPAPLPLRAYLAALKRRLCFGGFFVSIPQALAVGAARLASYFPNTVMTPEALRMLERGNTADPQRFTTALGRTPRPAADFLADDQVPALRRQAQLSWLVPLMRFTVAAMWLVTAWVSLFVYPHEASLALLARSGLEGALGIATLYGAAGLDALLGGATLFVRRRRWVYRAQLALIVFYTVIISLYLPEYWAHPYGPVLKNLPLLAMILALHELDDTHGSGSR